MRCSICGKQIEDGTLCKDCYNSVLQDKVVSKKTDNDKKILMKINRKFLPKYQLFVDWELVLFSLFLLLYSILTKKISMILGAVFFDFVLISFFLFWAKRIAVGTKLTFYENKVVYKFDFLFIHRKIEYKYSEISDIIYNQKFLQKKFKLGNITVISNKKGVLFNGIIVSDVANVQEVFEKLTNIVGPKLGA